MSGNIDKHPLRYSPVTVEIEKILMRRMHGNRLDGYTLETAVEIAALVMPALELAAGSSAHNPGVCASPSRAPQVVTHKTT